MVFFYLCICVLGVTILPLSLTFLLNTRKTTTCDVENPDSGTGKVQAYGWVKPFN
jgi:hypothetical protein